MRSGGFERHLRRTRRCYEERRDVLIDCLEDAKAKGAELTWQVPDGGMAVWVETRLNSAELADRAKRVGVHIDHEAEFQVKKNKGKGIRLGLAQQRPNEIVRGMELLFKNFP